MNVSVAIPTYNRGAILVETIERLLTLPERAAEIVVVDQTRDYDDAIEARLETWSRGGSIRWIRLPEPSIPHAMNEALRVAASPIVLFLDDDVVPSPNLVPEHAAAYESDVWAVVGQVMQPGEEPRHATDPHRGPLRDLEFPFNHDQRCFVENVIACNLSVDREKAIALGGFDENFLAAAYRFETDFARRVVDAGGLVRFEPRAFVHHLRIPTGGVRAHGDHRRTAAPSHSAGDYYFAMLHIPLFWRYAFRRFRQNVATRYLLRHPWNIPAKVIAEMRGALLARRLVSRGRRLMSRREYKPRGSS